MRFGHCARDEGESLDNAKMSGDSNRAMPRIFIISPHPVFSQGVETLLSQETDFVVVGKDTDIHRALDAIHCLQPEVILVDVETPACDQSSVIARLLAEHVGVRIVALNLHSNKLAIYRTEECVINQFSDLIDAIKAEEVKHQHKRAEHSNGVIPQLDKPVHNGG